MRTHGKNAIITKISWLLLAFLLVFVVRHEYLILLEKLRAVFGDLTAHPQRWYCDGNNLCEDMLCFAFGFVDAPLQRPVTLLLVVGLRQCQLLLCSVAVLRRVVGEVIATGRLRIELKRRNNNAYCSRCGCTTYSV